MTKEELAAVYRDYLAEEGFSPYAIIIKNFFVEGELYG